MGVLVNGYRLNVIRGYRRAARTPIERLIVEHDNHVAVGVAVISVVMLGLSLAALLDTRFYPQRRPYLFGPLLLVTIAPIWAATLLAAMRWKLRKLQRQIVRLPELERRAR